MHACSVKINQRVVHFLRMHEPRSIFFQMHTGNAYLLPFNLEIPFFAKRHIILAYLITLGKIGIKVVFPVELRKLWNSAIERQSYLQNLCNSLLVCHRQRAWMPHAYLAYVDIWPCFERIVRARTKHLALCFELGVYFKPYGWNVVHRNITIFW